MKSTDVLVLDGKCISKVHLERVAHPAKTFLNVCRAFSCLIKEDPCPNSKRGVVGRTFFTVSRRRAAIRLPVI